MPDISSSGPGQGGSSYRETTTKSYGKRIMDSIKGILFGLLLFAVSFVVLFWNEGRPDLSKLAATANRMPATTVDSTAEGQFVAANGTITAKGTLAEGKYLKPGHYLAVKRTAETYAWVEESSSKSESKVGGSEETTTEYTYKKDWVSRPADSSDFKISAGHENPGVTETDATLKAIGADVGAYGLDLKSLSLPKFSPAILTAENTNLSSGMQLASEKYLFKGSGSIGSPLVGDVRISYGTIPGEVDGVVFGRTSGSKILSYDGGKMGKLYRAFEGDADTAISTLKSEHTFMTWLLRGVGFLLMWIGLMLVLGPISIVLDVLPILGKVSGGAVKLVAFIVAVVLSILTILVSMVLHNIFAVIAVLVVALGGIIYWMKSKSKKGKKK